jgi:hypothetical protein
LGDAAVAGAEVEPKPPRTSNIISPGYDFPKSIERKSELVAFVEESPRINVHGNFYTRKNVTMIDDSSDYTK